VWDAKEEEGVSGEVLEELAKPMTWVLLFETLPIIVSSLTQLQWHCGSSTK
jgi:hypothetical protein